MTSVFITTATKLTSKQQEAFEASLTKKYGKELQTEYVVDPKIVGGVKLRIGSLLLDGTIAAKLDKIKAKLLNPAT